MKLLYSMATLCLIVITVSGSVQAMDAEQIIQKSQQAFYYAANAMRARITMRLIDADNNTRLRELTMLRLNIGEHSASESGKQKYFIYFHQPGDVRRMTFMVWKDPIREDQRWLFIPAVDLVRRIAADDKRTSFVGSDFTYEDISGRAVKGETHELLREEHSAGSEAYVIQSTPREQLDYTKRITWIDKQTFLPLREDYFDAQNELFRVFSADTIEIVNGWPTVMHRTMKNVKTGHRTQVTFDAVSYDISLTEEDFSERRMRRPLRAWIE